MMMFIKVLAVSLLLLNLGYVMPTEIDKELFAKVLKASEAEVDQIRFERSVAGAEFVSVPGHARRGVTKE
jgi:hypothetical protein